MDPPKIKRLYAYYFKISLFCMYNEMICRYRDAV